MTIVPVGTDILKRAVVRFLKRNFVLLRNVLFSAISIVFTNNVTLDSLI